MYLSYKKLIASCFLFLTFQATNAQWEIQSLPNKPSIRAIDAKSVNHIWISGSQGSLLKSTDEGKTWQNHCPAEYAQMDFRGIAVLSENVILAMSAGDASEGKAFILKTTDGGKSWKKVLSKAEKGIFFDTIKFKDSTTGYIIGDPIDSKPYLLKTEDAGDSWNRVSGLPDIIEGEASYAASNSCITLLKDNVWFNTQNRVYHSKNNGKSWNVYNTPFVKGASQGIFGIFAIQSNVLIAVGGDYLPNEKPQLQYSYSKNSGKGWHFYEHYWKIGLTEAIAPLSSKNELLSVGTHGTAISKDLGKTWNKIDQESFHVVKCFGNKCVASGATGRVGIINIP